MTCKDCWVTIPESLYEKVKYPSGAEIDELSCCITCMHSEFNEYAKLETEACAILKLYCNECEALFPADTTCDHHITQEKYDEVQEYKEKMGW